MKAIFNLGFGLLTLIFAFFVITPENVFAQTEIRILPVSTSEVQTSLLDEDQLINMSLGLQQFFLQELQNIGNVGELSREHILLLMKEMPPPDIDNLTEEEYKKICKREELKYLLKCSIESLNIVDKNILIPVNIVIINGKNGKEFWQKEITINQLKPKQQLTEHILLTEIFKPALAESVKEMKKLKY